MQIFDISCTIHGKRNQITGEVTLNQYFVVRDYSRRRIKALGPSNQGKDN